MAKIKVKERHMDAYLVPDGFIFDDVPGLSEQEEKWERAFAKDKYEALFHFGFINKEKWFTPSIDYLHHISELLIKKLTRHPGIELVREDVEIVLEEEELYRLKEIVPFIIGMEYVNESWLLSLWTCLLDIFKKEIKGYAGTVERYFAEYSSDINVAGRVFFHLVENADIEYPFAFMATYTTKAVKSKRAVHTPLKNALAEFEGEEKKLISLIHTVIKASDSSPFISDLLETGELFSPIKLRVEEAYTVLNEIPLYEEAGIMCRVPNWWRKRSTSLSISVRVGEKAQSKVGLDEIVDFTPSLKLGDEDISEKELKEFLTMAEGLVKFKGKWVEINKEKLEAALKAFERIRESSMNGGMTLNDAIRLELNTDDALGIQAHEKDNVDITISNGSWIRNLKELMLNPGNSERTDIVPSFQGELRNYQKDGYYWLSTMYKYGFGVCLADDMGLGKTIQVIAFLESRRVKKGGEALLILPASLIGNWQKEIEKFAPKMPYQILHKSSLKSSESVQYEEGNFLYITTYGMALRLEELKEKKWDYLILDEAQAIKNPGTKQTKAIKAIPAGMRVAMTGTPIENRLSDLWSLFDFLNLGLLGTAKEFSSLTKELKDDVMGYARLRKIIQPFMLRRLKTDRTIISDLPDKVEINEYTFLTQRQIALYKQLIRKIEETLLESEGIERKGLILSSIMRFKQICNHPDQYLGREEFKAYQSGKFKRLGEICETIFQKREKVIIFTQFREMTEPISEFIKGVFGREGYVLHGGTPVKRRNEIVAGFNSEKYIPYMVMSLRAGGVGLNLTAANHVIHFDRWWNPAVENQATDRAFRIGQTRNVMVYKFVTKGTIEEKINDIIEEKQGLANDLLENTGEKWITEYSNEDLMKIFALGGDM